MIFKFTAITSQGERLHETLEAEDVRAARQELMQRGLFVLKLEPDRKGERGHNRKRDRAAARGREGRGARARGAELLMFARQMSMMQRAGAPVVSALHAIREQPGRAAWHALIDDITAKVESGAALHEALGDHPGSFSGTFRSIVAAGEATGNLGDSFSRLAQLLEVRQRLNKRVVSALAYPCALLLLAIGVVATMTLFVLPRFATLFEMLDSELPFVTQFMLNASSSLKTTWPIVVGAPVAFIGAAVVWARTPRGRAALERLSVRIPLVGKAVAGVILSRLLLVWAAMLRSHVSVLDTVQQAREITSHAVFAELIDQVENAVVEGRTLSRVLKSSGIVPAPVVSAIATGEETGKLAESMEFVGQWMEEETNTTITALTRAIEPAILLFMGLVVGTVCIALFLPLFDIAAAGG